jgi:hypothetical protein
LAWARSPTAAAAVVTTPALKLRDETEAGEQGKAESISDKKTQGTERSGHNESSIRTKINDL